MASVLFCVLAVGCAGSEQSKATLDEESVSITLVSSNGDCGADIHAGEASGGGHLRRALSCGSYTVDVSGICKDCNSVMFESGDTSFSIDVASDGSFKTIVSLGSFDGSVLLTPVDSAGVLGNVVSAEAVVTNP
ncbi:MAG TPA: hypothetical protein VI895_10570 [Bdellovibrionota bacterium]|nr:hypothetical protein [Bdellovibrionota bacterium]